VPQQLATRVARSQNVKKQVRRALWIFFAPVVLAERGLRRWAASRSPASGPRGPATGERDFIHRLVYSDVWRRLDVGWRAFAGRIARTLRKLDVRDPSRVLLIRAVGRELRRARPDLVHVHGFRVDQAWILPWLAARGLATVYTEHATVEDWGGALEPGSPDLLASADALTSVSDRARESLAAILPAARRVGLTRHIVTAPEGAATLARATGPGDIVRFVCVARLCTEKGIEPLLRAFARARDQGVAADLTLAGDGPDRARFERLAATLGVADHVRFRGRFPHSALGAILGEADVFVLASLTEGLPVSVMEAMAHGLPIVATRVGGVPEVVRDLVSGVLVPPGDPEALCQALGRVAGDASLRARLGAGARAAWKAGDHDHAAVARDTLALYTDVLTRRAGGASCASS
jgi:glycosyltransferase involved in cell wall biosynthesis